MGMLTCGHPRCMTCALVIEGNVFRSSETGEVFQILGNYTCQSSYVVYLVTCDGCSKQYVGRTTQPLHRRASGHNTSAKKVQACLGSHMYNCPGKMLIQAIDDSDNFDELKMIEGYWQRRLDVQLGRRERFDRVFAAAYELQRMSL